LAKPGHAAQDLFVSQQLGAGMTKGFKEWFVADRARALATVYLTRRDDLAITDTKEQTGVEFLVSIRQNGKPSGRAFGVYLKGAMSPVSVEHANKVLKPSVEAFQRLGGFLYPVCLFFFTMVHNKGYFAWLLEPVSDQGQPRLAKKDVAECEEMDHHTVDRIVERVNAWYDASATAKVF
jgi:hypothetical protein